MGVKLEKFSNIWHENETILRVINYENSIWILLKTIEYEEKEKWTMLRKFKSFCWRG